MATPRSRGSRGSYCVDGNDYDDDDTISDISFDDVGVYYDREDVIIADRTSSFALTSQHRMPEKLSKSKSDGRTSVDSTAGPEKQGTIRGVLIPCLQSNMFGAMMFMRLPWITAQTGVYLAVVSFVLCLGSTFLTLLSLIAISTNGKIKKSGGLYVFVRKHLGLEMGGAIGMLHLIQKILTVSMHCLASSEAILNGFHMDVMPHQVTIGAIIICSALSIIVMIPKMVKRVDDLSLAFLLISGLTVLSFFMGMVMFASGFWLGNLEREDRIYLDNIYPNYELDRATHITPSFFALLALYYASASGLMSASTRAGYRLATPARSIPLGSLSAVSIISVILIFIVLMCGLCVSHDALLDEKFVLALVAWPRTEIVQAGIAVGCIGVAMTNIKGIPRLIGILDNDGAVPFFRLMMRESRHGHLHGHHDSTKQVGVLRSHVFTFFMVALPCLAGNMNYLAVYAAVPSLLAHMAVNLSCFLMSVIRAPGFRPHWQYYSWHTALVGSFWCLGMMLLMNWWLSILYIFLLVVLMIVISKSTARNDWGDALSGLLYQQAKNMLLYMADPASEVYRVRNWRPQILVVTHIEDNRQGSSPFRFAFQSLIRLAGQMKMGKGLTMVAVLVEGDPAALPSLIQEEALQDLDLFMAKEGILGFTRFIVVKSLQDGADTVLQMAGLGSLQPNTVMCEWSEGLENMSIEDRRTHVDRYRVIAAANKALVVVKGANFLPTNQARSRGNIDIWWVVNVHDGGLLLLLPHLLWLHKVWHHCHLRLFVVMTRPEDNPHKMKRRAEEHLDSERVDATVEVVDLSDVAAAADVYTTHVNDSARDRLLSRLNNPVTFSVALRHEKESDADGGQSRKPQLSGLFGTFHHSSTPNGTPIVPPPPSQKRDTSSDISLNVLNSELHSPVVSPEASPLKENGQEEDHAEAPADTNDDEDLPSSNGVFDSPAGFLTDDSERSGSPDDSPREMEMTVMRQRKSHVTRPSLTSGIWMQIAVQFNILIKQRSHDSKLVVLNLPPLTEMTDQDFVNYTNTLTNNVKPVLLVRGTGKEIITSYG